MLRGATSNSWEIGSRKTKGVAFPGELQECGIHEVDRKFVRTEISCLIFRKVKTGTSRNSEEQLQIQIE
jgi:hypothetical protein